MQAIKNPAAKAVISFVLLFALDQFLKWAALNQVSHNTLPDSTIGLSLHFNSGVIGGLMSSVPSSISQIFFSVLGVFLSLFSVMIYYFLKDRAVPLLKIGSLLFGCGLICNVWDRSTRGYVVDYLAIMLSDSNGFIVNFADLVLLLGAVLIGLALVLENKKIWLKNESRKKLFVDPSFQTHYIIILVITAAVNAFMIGIYSFAFLGIYITKADTLENLSRSKILTDFGVGLLILEVCYLIVVTWLGLYFSHRAAGPIFAFENFTEKLLSKNKRETEIEMLKLRRNDHFKVLEKIANRLFQFFQNP
jgi:signal peptidase II